MKNAAILIIFILLMSFTSFAQVSSADRSPTVDISVHNSLDNPVKEVDTDAVIIITAEDEGFDAGISSIQLIDSRAVIARKECLYRIKCEMRINVHVENESTHRYTVLAIDAGGRQKSESVSIKFRGQQQAPVISAPSELEGQENQKIDFYVFSSDRNNDNIILKMESGPEGSVFFNNHFIWTPTYKQSGTYTVRFKATDDDGSTTRTVKIKIRDVNQEPFGIKTLPTDKDVKIDENEERVFEIILNDSDTRKPKIQWFVDSKAVSSSKKYTYKPDFDDSGLHVIAVQITDESYSRRESWSVTVKNINRAPTISVISKKEVDEGDTIRLKITGTDKDKDALVYSASGLPLNAKFNPDTHVFEWKTQEGNAGSYLINFKVSDQKGQLASKAVDIRVNQDTKTRYQRYTDFLKEKELEAQKAREANKTASGQNIPNITIQNTNTPSIINLFSSCRAGYLCSNTVVYSR